MDDTTIKAIARVRKALDGKDPANHPHVVRLNDDGTELEGVRTPLAEVNTDDILTLCAAVPLDKIDQHVKDCHLGAKRAGPNRKVMKQTQCLHRLLGLIPTPAAEPEGPAAAA